MLNNLSYAYLYADVEPDDEQWDKLLKFLKERHSVNKMKFVYDENIRCGFKLAVGDKVYDWTSEGRFGQLRADFQNLPAGGDILPLLEEAVDAFVPEAVYEEIGTVEQVGDGVVTVGGLENAEYGEILLFDGGARGLVQDLREDSIGCILFDDGNNVEQGGTVRRSGKIAGMPVGDAFIGRVIDALGNPIDGKGEIMPDGYNPVERAAPGIIERQPVNTPLETGILAIDSMFPIGRGQRELIIGDRQTGKTAIAVDTIINQKGKDVICIYVAIGQKASSVASLVNTLKKYGAMDYTVVVAATASDTAPLQYIAPYAGCALGEYFMYSGRDVFIVYDDLSKHAVAYRTLSLLLGRTPGREAYPGDIFYLHSRLLERSAHLSDEKGGGSLTAFPIVETQQGDVSAYIPTNVISITDGQIFLETELFYSGQRPAINVGISVSRVGGDAQAKIVKSACKGLKIALSQYQEKLVFTQFSNDLDIETRNTLEAGGILMRILRQKQYSPVSRSRLVLTFTAALCGKFAGLEGGDIENAVNEFCKKFEEKYPYICEQIEKRGDLTEEEVDLIKNFTV